MKQTIPVVDLSDFDDPNRRAEFVRELGNSLQELGFVAVVNHGIDDSLLTRTYEVYRSFFAQDASTKQKVERAELGRRRGYTSFGVEHAKDSDKADLKEFFHVGRELASDATAQPRLPPNVWPDDVDFRSASLETYGALDAVAGRVLAAFGVYLGQSERFFPDLVADGNSVLRVIHYPVCEGFDQPGVMRAAAHEDINLMTLLAPADASGLEILTREGTWLPIHAIPGQIIVDTGDMMSRITADLIPATTHRVVNPVGVPKARYSMPFFVHPRIDATLEVLKTCVSDGEQPKYAPIQYEEFLMERLRAIGLAK